MPIVQIDFAEGRSAEQKREIAQKVTTAISETLKCPPEAITVIMHELPLSNIAKAGNLLSDKK